MMPIIILIIIILVLIITYASYKRTKKKRAIKIIQLNAKKIVDGSMADVEKNLRGTGIIDKSNNEIDGELVADVWGKLVLAFHYKMKVIKDVSIDELKNDINQELAIFAKENDIMWNNQPALVVSDIWQKDYELNVDIAYIKNDETLEYLDDLKKV